MLNRRLKMITLIILFLTLFMFILDYVIANSQRTAKKNASFGSNTNTIYIAKSNPDAIFQPTVFAFSRVVFIDLGAKNGDSLLEFFELNSEGCLLNQNRFHSS